MPNQYLDIFKTSFQPLEPIPTEAKPVLRKIDGIKAVLFDVYGTLIISASGEVGTATDTATSTALPPEKAIEVAFGKMGIESDRPAEQIAELFFGTIKASHADSRGRGIEYPEVDILDIWRRVLAELLGQSEAEQFDVVRLAIEYESRVNPCWPMPNLQKCLQSLLSGGMLLGIVSNAQFFTPLVFEALLGKTVDDLGFLPDLQYYSYRQGFAKPGTGLYELAVEGLARRGIAPDDTLYVGNDVLNDILPADVVGFNTALFAGDRRSLRCRRDDPRVSGIEPDLVLTDLDQLADCI